MIDECGKELEALNKVPCMKQDLSKQRDSWGCWKDLGFGTWRVLSSSCFLSLVP